MRPLAQRALAQRALAQRPLAQWPFAPLNREQADLSLHWLGLFFLISCDTTKLRGELGSIAELVKISQNQ
jgi:hypothetical protein